MNNENKKRTELHRWYTECVQKSARTTYVREEAGLMAIPAGKGISLQEGEW